MHRADGLLGEVLAAALGLNIAADLVLALALAAILLAMALDKVKPPLFASAQAAQLAARLLLVSSLPVADGAVSADCVSHV